MSDHLEEDDLQRWQRLAEEFGLPPPPAPSPPKPRVSAPPEPRYVPAVEERAPEPEPERYSPPPPVVEHFEPEPEREHHVPPPNLVLHPEPVDDVREDFAPDEPGAEPPQQRSGRSGRQRHRRGRGREETPPVERELAPLDNDAAGYQDPIAAAEAQGVETDAPVEAGEEGPRRSRRRRGRRSSGRGRTPQTEEAILPMEAPVLPSEPAAADDQAEGEEPEGEPVGEEERRQRGRRGGRGRKPRRHVEREERPPVAAQEEEEELESQEVAGDDLEDDDVTPQRDAIDDEEISFANWTVPSWQELIGSLYRPER